MEQQTPSNEDRAELAAEILDEYGIKKEGSADYASPETIAVDLITDLLHLINAHGCYDPLEKLKLAEEHFIAERTPPNFPPKFCGLTDIPLGSKVRITGNNEGDYFLGFLGKEGEATHPSASGCTDPDWIGVRFTGFRHLVNFRKDEVTVIEEEDNATL